jgi:hypothetical protein
MHLSRRVGVDEPEAGCILVEQHGTLPTHERTALFGPPSCHLLQTWADPLNGLLSTCSYVSDCLFRPLKY